jgi:VWFA-related protein
MSIRTTPPPMTNLLKSRPSARRSLHPWLARVILLTAALTALTCVAGFVRAQDQQPSSTEPQLHHEAAAPVGKISSSVKLVTVYAVVRDKHGKIVPNLAKDDFSLEEDGRPQTISHFIVQTDVPLTLGLLVDTSFSQRAMIVPERQASYTFLDHLLTAKDVAFVLHFDRDVELLQDLTASRPKLQAALQQLDTPQLNRDGGGSGSGDDDRRQRGRGAGGGTHLYDAIWLASNDVINKQQGRKALFVLSDGVDRGSKESLTDAIEAAQRAGAAVYTIYFAGEEHENDGYQRRRRWGGGVGGPVGWPGGGGGWPGGGGGGGNQYPRQARVDGKKILLQISEQTGGVMFEVSKNLSLEKIYDVAAEGLRNQYDIGYTPNPPDTDPGYHTIHLTATKKDLTLQARQGYYSGH